ncbi:TBCA [Lepeophtheirus salmonis]|uniref:Tubulin-specific chaperone A n=1 Tax=Lepeophtheirus salmonis TaxID=72036 RepID=A0A7R8HCP9_LEPSM|nr:TBCA [Lepeophtheirus salmonis]CAF3014618.1 TBCA [Lepeophtheirus salmonis]
MRCHPPSKEPYLGNTSSLLLGKEKLSYRKEADMQKAKVEKMKADGRDECEVKKMNECMQESLMMIPDCHRRLENAIPELKAILNEFNSEDQTASTLNALIKISHANIIQHLIGNECIQKNVPRGMCAILFDDDGCEGWEKPIATGYQKLSFRYRNDAENCCKLNRKTLVDDISAVKCECPDGMATSSGASRSGAPRPIDPNSNIAKEKCPTISATACAVLYDEENCVSDDWDPIVLNNGEEKTFSLRSSLINLKYKNDVESFVVRQGCTLEAYDDSDWSDDGIRASAQTGDLLINLDTHRNRKYDSLHNDIESVRCNCR